MLIFQARKCFLRMRIKEECENTPKSKSCSKSAWLMQSVTYGKDRMEGIQKECAVVDNMTARDIEASEAV